LLKKAAEDMKFYKMELENREKSYNVMFGSNPNVGVFNPVTSSAKPVGATVRQPSGSKENLSGMGIGGRSTGVSKGK
jgi:hypothetical protein